MEMLSEKEKEDWTIREFKLSTVCGTSTLSMSLDNSGISECGSRIR